MVTILMEESRKFDGELFGSFMVSLHDHQLKNWLKFLIKYIHVYMGILYQIAKFKSTNNFVMGIWDPTAKFNSCQYFLLDGYAGLNIVCTVFVLIKRKI